MGALEEGRDPVMVYAVRRSLSVSRVKKYDQTRKTIKEWTGKDISELTQSELDLVFFNLNNSGWTGSTKASFWALAKTLVKMYHLHLRTNIYKGAWRIKIKTADDLITQDELSAMIQREPSIRNRTILAVSFGLGCRPHEIRNVRIKDVSYDNNGIIFALDGKTGQRSVRLLWFDEIFRQYLKTHKDEHNPSAFVFYAKEDPTHRLTAEGWIKIFHKAAERAGIRKVITPYTMRHSERTLLDQALTDQEQNIRHGWSPTTRMHRIYSHVRPSVIDKKLVEIEKLVER